MGGDVFTFSISTSVQKLYAYLLRPLLLPVKKKTHFYVFLYCVGREL